MSTATGEDVVKEAGATNSRKETPPSSSGQSASLSKKLSPNLPGWEITLYIAAWVGGVLYAVYNVYLCSRREIRCKN